MKIKNTVIFTSKNAIEEILKTDLPIKCAWQFALLSGELGKGYTALNATKDALIRKYGTLKDGNYSVNPSDENFAKFADELNELFEQEVEINFKKIELPQQINGSEIKIKPEVLLALVDFVSVKE